MGKARLVVVIQFHFRSIGKVKIARCDDDTPSWIDIIALLFTMWHVLNRNSHPVCNRLHTVHSVLRRHTWISYCVQCISQNLWWHPN